MSLISNYPKVLIIIELSYIDPNQMQGEPYGKININLIAYSMKLKNDPSSVNKYITSTNPTNPTNTSLSDLPKMDDFSDGIYIMFMDKTIDKIYIEMIKQISAFFVKLNNSIYETDSNIKSVKMENDITNQAYSLYRFTKFPDSTQDIRDNVFIYGIKHLIELIIINTSISNDIIIKPIQFNPTNKSNTGLYKFDNALIGSS